MLATNFNKDINIFQRLYNELLMWGKKNQHKDLDGVFKIAILIC